MDWKRKIAQRKGSFNQFDIKEYPTEEMGSASKITKYEGITNKTVFKKHQTKDSAIADISDDSFECLEDTQTLISKQNDIMISNVNITEADFSKRLVEDLKRAELMHLDSDELTNDSKSLDIRNDQIMQKKQNDVFKTYDGDISQVSQFFNKTQVIEQIDSIISEVNNSQNYLRLKGDGNVDEIGKPLAKQENVEEKFEDDSILNSFTYKREVDDLFNKLETTICELGPTNTEIINSQQNSEIANLLTTLIEKVKSNKALQDRSNETSINDMLNITEYENLASLFKESFSQDLSKHLSKCPKPISNITTNKVLGNFYDLPNKVKNLIKVYRGIDKLYDWQHECLNLPAIKNRKNLIYALPTSGGKTLVAEILLIREILCRNKNVIFVLPYVAIVQEKIWALSPFAVALDFLIEEYAGGKGTFPPRKRRRKNSVYIATMEKALGLINSLIETNRLSELGLVIVDELHLVGDKSRGPVLESFLTKLMYINNNIQIIGMSATIGNLQELCVFLKSDVYSNDFRPIELVEYVKCNDEIAKINYDAKEEDDIFVFHRKLEFKYSETLLKTDPDKLTGLVMEVIPHGSCLIFCSTKKNCENVALLLCKVMFSSVKEYKKDEKFALLEALKRETDNICTVLKISIQFGVAYHHSGLTSEERLLIEHGFRTGTISVICCTSTLAAGVNLPAKRVILRQPYIGREFINLSRYKQMVGRAGRAGLEEIGESILICTKEDLPKVKNLLMCPMDISVSNMHEDKDLRQFLLSCISLNLANTRAQLQEISRKTLLAVQQERLNVNLKQLVDTAITELFKLKAIEIFENHISCPDCTIQLDVTNNSSTSCNVTNPSSGSSSSSKTRIVVKNDSKLIVSKLGLAAIKGGLELSKAHILYDDLIQAQASLVLFNCLHLIYLVTPYNISEQIKISKPHYYNIYSQLSSTELQTAKVLGINEACAMKLLANKPIKNIPERVLNRFYVSLMIFDLWNEKPVYKVAEKYQIDRGLIQNLMVSVATFASNVVNFCTVLDEFWTFSCLLNGMSLRLQYCCVSELIPLMELPNVKQNRAKQLYNAGFKNLQRIAKADPRDLVEKIEYMSIKLANQLIATSKLLLLEKVENLREEAEDVLEGTELPNMVK